ncbi:MAG: protein-export chaperone SecB, partial [Deltaproteobacteria bacterium]|nr:protein-export chaperone SecB [Deltaproteobacteria bacterium]MBW1795512.1 protein-export chaperone SecB [Deltaproteobacteria bacterium]
KDVEPIAKINCPAILFPFLRECVADITRRAGFNPLILPPINFVELAKQKELKGKNK